MLIDPRCLGAKLLSNSSYYYYLFSKGAKSASKCLVVFLFDILEVLGRIL